MFIFRSGRKYNKKTLGLENVKRSTINIMRAQANIDQKEVDKNRQAILRILKNKSYNESFTNFYHENELDIALAKLEIEKSKSIEEKPIYKMITNPKSQFIGYMKIEYFEKIDTNDIAKSAIEYVKKIDFNKDSLAFYETKEIKFNSKKIIYYFFKRINIEEDSYQTNKSQLTGIAFITEGSTLKIKGYYKLTSKTYLEEKDINSLQNAMID